MRTVRVGLGDRGYDIHIGAGLIPAAGALLADPLRGRTVIPVADETVAGLHLAPLVASLAGAGIGVGRAVIVPPGESSKSFAVLEGVIGSLLAQGVDRRCVVVAVGGGVIGDLAGFAASATLRGLDFVQVPTTLLAQVDSAVGGKTGINTRYGKNLVGAFHQPIAVLADMNALDTLPARELRAGYAEVVKYGLLGDAAFFAWLEDAGAALVSGDMDARAKAVERSCMMKAEIVARDERESGDRALLNLGHTFGHALETAAGYGSTLLHGEAVAIGMVMAAHLSCRLGVCPADDAVRIGRHLAAIGLPICIADAGIDPHDPAFAPDALLSTMRRDKKAVGGRLTFVLLRGIGHAYVSKDVPEVEVLSVLKRQRP